MLTKAVRQRDLIDVHDPAAILAYRLDHMERISAQDTALGMETPVARAESTRSNADEPREPKVGQRLDAKAAWRERQQQANADQQRQQERDQTRDQAQDQGLGFDV